jgi:nucleotide-binding universal stress UspA family protein
MGQIVVGVDGSEPANHALAWAGGEARLRGTTLEAVCAYHIPTGWFGIDGSSVLSVPVALDDLERHARDILDAAVSETLGEDSGVDVVKTPAMGQPADVLIEASSDADLLVVGNRGRGDLGSVLLGSVGMHCVHHAPCPVVVVRMPKHG